MDMRFWGSESYDLNLFGTAMTSKRDLVIRMMLLSQLIGVEFEIGDSPFRKLFKGFQQKFDKYKVKEFSDFTPEDGFELQMVNYFLQVQFKVII